MYCKAEPLKFCEDRPLHHNGVWWIVDDPVLFDVCSE